MEVVLHQVGQSVGSECIAPYTEDMPDVYWADLYDVEQALYRASGIHSINLNFIEDLVEDGVVRYQLLGVKKFAVDGDTLYTHHIRFYTEKLEVYCFSHHYKEVSGTDLIKLRWYDTFNERLKEMYEV